MEKFNQLPFLARFVIFAVVGAAIFAGAWYGPVPGLTEALRQEFSMPVEILNPFQRIQANGAGDLVEQNAGQLAVAVGLALRSFESL